CRVDDCGKCSLCVNAVYICIMQKSLALKHLYICYSRKSRKFFHSFFDSICFIYFCFIRCEFSCEFTKIYSNTETCETYSCFIFMLFDSVNRLTYNYKVVQFGEWCVVSSRACHIDDTFLESDNLTCCYDSHSL